MQFVCLYIFNVCSPIFFFEECSNFDNFFFVVVVGKISALWWSCSKNFLNSRMVNLSVGLLNILFGYKFRNNRTMAWKFWHVFQLHMFYIIKNVIGSYIDLFIRHFRNVNTLGFFVHFYRLNLSRNFGMF